MGKNYVKTLLKTAYRGEKTGRPEFNTAIHASDIFSLCPRKFALCRENKVPFHVTEYIGTGLALTFEIGRKIQDITVSRLHKTGSLIGTWRYTCCGTTIYGFHTIICPKCSSASHPRYIDTPLELSLGDDVCIKGNIDAQVVCAAGSIESCEIKSIKADEFKKLTEPQLQHQYQLSTYLYLINHPDTLLLNRSIKDIEKQLNLKFNNKSGTVIYIPKEAVVDPLDKVFEMPLSKKFMIEIATKLQKVRKYLSTKQIPKRELCSSDLSIPARDCQVRKICLEVKKNADKK